MLRKCDDCGRVYDDEFRWTICPHRSLGQSPRPEAAEGTTMSGEHSEEIRTPIIVKDVTGAGADAAEAGDRLPPEALTNIQPGDVLKTNGGERIRIGNDTPPDVFCKPHSKTPASCGRIVHVYSNRWNNSRPGIVTQAWRISGTHQLINVTVIPDGCNDRKWLDEMAKGGQGTSLGSVGLYDPLTPEERAALICGPGASADNNPPRYHCEWMPFQAGQATRTQAAEGDLSKRLAAAEAQLAKATVALAMLAKSAAFNLKATDPNLHQHLTGC